MTPRQILIMWLAVILLWLCLVPAWAAPFATCTLPSDPKITACDYEDASLGESMRLVVEVDTARGDAPDYRVCKRNISHWAPGSSHTVARCRSVNTATGEVSAWAPTDANMFRPAVATATVRLVGGPVIPPPPTPVSMWGATAPGASDAGPDSAYTLGVRFRPSVSGSVLGLRFYKFPGNVGPHPGALWTNAGTSLGTLTFTAETATGWQQATFASPIAVQAGQTYVASYRAAAGHYAWARGFMWPHIAGPLTALAGVYVAGTGFPQQIFDAANYWVDVIFQPN